MERKYAKITYESIGDAEAAALAFEMDGWVVSDRNLYDFTVEIDDASDLESQKFDRSAYGLAHSREPYDIATF